MGVHEQIFMKNIECMARCRPELHTLQQAHPPVQIGEFLSTPAGVPTMLYRPEGRQAFLAYNTQDPWQDAAIHFDIVTPDARGLIVFVGMGLGYGPLLILRERPLVDKIVIVEPSLDLFCAALQAVDLTELLIAGKVEFFVGDLDMAAFQETVLRIASVEDTRILRHGPSMEWQPDLYNPLNDNLFMLLNMLNAGGGTVKVCGPNFFENRLRNLTLLRHAGSLDDLKGLFQGKPAVLVAAGPSLDRSIPDLKKVVGRCLLIAADSALAPLLEADIVPDFVTTIDFLDLNFEKIAPYAGKEWPFTFVSMIKATPLMPKRFPVRHLVLAFPEDPTHNWMIEALGIKTCAAGALSVAHLSLGLALIMGADPIFFVGQDLSYTSISADHAAHTIIMRSGLPKDMEIFYAKSIDGGEVPTDRQLMSLQKQFEDIIAGHPRTYFNASAAGAHIAGTRVLSLAQAVDVWFPETVAVRDAVDRAIAPGKSFDIDGFLRESRQVLARVDSARKKIRQSENGSGKLRKHLENIASKRSPIHAMKDFPAKVQQLLVSCDALNVALDEDRIFEHVMELTYDGLSDNEHLRADNSSRVETHGYLAWLVVELERIDNVNAQRRKALDTYAGLLGDLVRHLEKEDGMRRGDAETAILLARLYLKSGDLVEARRILAGVCGKNADCAAFYLLFGAVFAGLLDFDAARAAWSKALALDPACSAEIEVLRHENVDCWVAYADKYGNEEKTGDNFLHLLPVWLQRVALLLDGQQEVPASLKALWEKHCGKMEQLLAGNHLESMETICAAWRPLGGYFPALFNYAAQLAFLKGDLEAALGSLREGASLEPENTCWLPLMARILLRSGKAEEGVAMLRKAVAVDPQSAVLWEEVGDMLLSAADHAGAIIAYEQCFLTLPDRLDPLLKMGHAYQKGGSRHAAEAAYEAVLARDPAHVVATQNLTELRQGMA